jgi:energy-coupling factor transporter ATP-binding protein EcfA2
MDRRDWLKLSLTGTAALVLGTIPNLIPRQKPPEGFRLGLDAVDDYSGNWNRHEMVTICGEISSGKTALANICAKANADDGHQVVVLTDRKQRYNGFTTKEMPPSFYDGNEFFEYLMGIKCDLLVIDSELPALEKLNDVFTTTPLKSLWQFQTLITKIMSFVWETNASVVRTFDLRSPSLSIIDTITDTPIQHYSSSKILRLTKTDFDSRIVNVNVVKNRHGRNNMSFYYKYLLHSNRIDMVPIPKITWAV